MSSSTQTLQDEPWIDEFFNLVAVETLPLFEYLDFEFLSEYDVFAPTCRGRTRDHHHQNCSKASFTVITRVSTGHVLSPENYRTRLSGLAVDSIDRRPETRSIGFSLISTSLLKTCLVASLSRPLPAACLAQPSVSTQLILKPSRGIMTLHGTTIQQQKSSTTALVSASFRQAQRYQSQRSSPKQNKPRKRQRCASHVTRSRSSTLSDCLETVHTIYSIGTTSCSKQESCRLSHTIHETRAIRLISTTVSKIESPNLLRT